MEKFNTLINDLKLCYQTKIPYTEDYIRLNNNQRNDLCKGVRNELMKQLLSDELKFSNVVRERIAEIKSEFH